MAVSVSLFIRRNDRYQKFIGETASVPLYDFEIPIMADEMVSMEKGTGAVMCATFGDTADVSWYQTHHLPYKKTILPDGTISSEVPYVGGMEISLARKTMVEKLKAKGLIVKQETISHGVAVHERCGTAVEIIPSNQWYIDVLSEKDRFLKAADEISWASGSYEKTLSDMGGKFEMGLVYFETTLFRSPISGVVLQGL